MSDAMVSFTASGPHLRQSWRTKSTGDLNLRTFLAITLSVSLFIAYGVVIGSPSVITANSLAGIMVVSLVILKIRHG